MNDARALLAATVDVLREDLAEHAKGDLRYKALLSANAVAMAERELAFAAQSAAAVISGITPEDIRGGKHDADHELIEVVLREAAIRAYIANPDALTEAEKVDYLEVGANGD
ncbi:MAG: hypothetical protein AAGD23_07360 [Pseudomonadota bacterium]